MPVHVHYQNICAVNKVICKYVCFDLIRELPVRAIIIYYFITMTITTYNVPLAGQKLASSLFLACIDPDQCQTSFFVKSFRLRRFRSLPRLYYYYHDLY